MSWSNTAMNGMGDMSSLLSSMAQGAAGLQNQLIRQAQNPVSSALGQQILANTNNSIAGTQRAYQYGQGQLSQALANRGIGNSSFTGNSLANYWRGYGNTVANMYQQQNSSLTNLAQQALSSALSNALGSATGAMSGYQGIAQADAQAKANSNAWMGALGQAVGIGTGMALK